MRIIDMPPENETTYFCCLEDWSDEIREAGDHKQRWYEKMKDKGLRVKFAVDENEVIGGMIQYLPIENSIVEGENLYMVLCVWVHAHKQGRGDFRKRGMGSALLNAAEEDCRQLRTNGLVVWGVSIPVFMRASWYKKHGYQVVDKKGILRLLWKPFNDRALPPKFIRPKKYPQKGEKAVNITIFRNGWCPAMNMVFERAKRASKDFIDQVQVTEIETTNPKTVQEWGIIDGLFLDGKEVSIGPPPSYKKIHKKIAKKIKSKSSRFRIFNG